MKKVAWIVFGIAVLTVVGCDNRSESEKAMDRIKGDVKKASSDFQKSVDNL
jgi:hypothetical protein